MGFIDSNGHDSYVFYLPEWKNEAIDDQKRLMEYYGVEIEEIHLVEIVDNNSLINAWNSMGVLDDGSIVDIQTVIINTHANPNVLGYGNNSQDVFSSNE